MKTVPDTSIGQKSTGYIILALASEKARRQITSLTHELARGLPGVLWTMPPRQLHFTLVEVVQPLRDYGSEKDYLYDQFETKYLKTVVQVLAKVPSFTISFDTVEASQNAIILRASNSSHFNSIRAELMEHIALPEGTREPPDITHSTIARYVKSIDLE